MVKAMAQAAAGDAAVGCGSRRTRKTDPRRPTRGWPTFAAVDVVVRLVSMLRPGATRGCQTRVGPERWRQQADELERARQTIATLRERNTALLDEKETASKDVEALKKQAKGLSDEYGRLLMQKESLENKLADYELVFGDGDLKKSK